MGKHDRSTTKSVSQSPPPPAAGTLTPEQVTTAVNTAVENLSGIQGPMTAEQIRSLPKVPVAGLPIVNAEAAAGVQYPATVPPTIDPAQMQTDYARIQALRILQEANQLNQRRIDATLRKEEAVYWSKGLNLYSFFQRQQASEPNLIPVVEKMTALLAKGPRAPKNDPAETTGAGSNSSTSGSTSSSSTSTTSNGSTGTSTGTTSNPPATPAGGDTVTVYGPSGVVGTSAPTNVAPAAAGGGSGSSSHS